MFFQLRQLWLIRQSLTPAAVKILVHAFISSRLHYCNQLFVGVSGQLLDKLQSLQNSAARLVTGARKFYHITPMMRELHWLSVRQRLKCKTAILVFKCIHGQALCTCLNAASRRLTITAAHTCSQPTHPCCLFHGHGQPTVTGALRQWTNHMEQFTCGTVVK